MRKYPVRRINYSTKFEKELLNLPRRVQQTFLEKEGLFLENVFHTSLDTHKLHGKYKKYWAFTITSQYRIMFEFAKNGVVNFINIGTHNIYRS